MMVDIDRACFDDNAELKQKPKYIIGSGWWSSELPFGDQFSKRKELGDPLIRSVEFFDMWYDSIQRNASPYEIVVVDSNAPQKPAKSKRENVKWVVLPFNAKHSTEHLGLWSGWTRSVIVSAMYALASGCDYFVYVEQDCLLFGDGIIERCIESASTGISFGSGQGTPQPIQQSFFIVSAARLPGFINNLCSLNMKDSDLSPEWKFVFATFRPFVTAANFGYLQKKIARKLAVKYAKERCFNFLPIGSGRVRPLAFDDEHLYFQHGNSDELAEYRKRISG